jgi:hypothetical protein
MRGSGTVWQPAGSDHVSRGISNPIVTFNDSDWSVPPSAVPALRD